jgi:hypothetical protein
MSNEQKDDGGPAFPLEYPPQTGMTLRDWFAGQVLLGMSGSGKYDWRAQEAYALADAMLAERKKEPMR